MTAPASPTARSADAATAFRTLLLQRYVDLVRHCAALGMTVDAVDTERVRMRLPCRPEFIGDTEHALLHNGVITSLIDSACGCAVGARIGKPQRIATLDLRVDYLRAATFGADLLCEAECYRLARSIAFVRAQVWQGSAETTPIAHAVAAFILSTSTTNSGFL